MILGFSQDMYFYSSLVNKSIRAAYGQAKNKKLAKFPCPHKKGVLHLAHIHTVLYKVRNPFIKTNWDSLVFSQPINSNLIQKLIT